MMARADYYRSQEIVLRRQEIEIERKKLDRQSASGHVINWSILIPAIFGIFAAAIAFLSDVFVTYQNHNASQIVEKQKHQNQLILNAVQTDVERAKKNLAFLIEAKLIDDAENIQAALEKGETLSIPAFANPEAPPGVDTIKVPMPPEISGVAALRHGYVVASDQPALPR